MTEALITIQDASEISGKSIQTIRRAIKAHKLICKRKKTPQGFNYLINRDSLLQAYNIQSTLFDREHAGLNRTEGAVVSELPANFVQMDEFNNLQTSLHSLIEEQKQDRESFMRFMKAFQDKFVALENQVKVLEQPKKKWYQIWK